MRGKLAMSGRNKKQEESSWSRGFSSPELVFSCKQLCSSQDSAGAPGGPGGGGALLVLGSQPAHGALIHITDTAPCFHNGNKKLDRNNAQIQTVLALTAH